MELCGLPDEQLMHQYQKGSQEAFEVLYERHSGRIYGFIKNRIRNEERTAELFQEIFLKLHRSKHLYQVDRSFLPWFFSIARSVVNDGLRKQLKGGVTEMDDVELVATPSVNSFGEALEIMTALPILQRRAVELRYVEDKSFEDIAKELNTNPQNVRKIVSRAVQTLRGLLREKV